MAHVSKRFIKCRLRSEIQILEKSNETFAMMEAIAIKASKSIFAAAGDLSAVTNVKKRQMVATAMMAMMRAFVEKDMVELVI